MFEKIDVVLDELICLKVENKKLFNFDLHEEDGGGMVVVWEYCPVF